MIGIIMLIIEIILLFLFSYCFVKMVKADKTNNYDKLILYRYKVVTLFLLTMALLTVYGFFKNIISLIGYVIIIISYILVILKKKVKSEV